MIKLINYIALLIIALILTFSCTKDSKMQNYFVNHQSDNNFLAIDVPASVLGIDTKDVSDDVKEAVSSFKKLNILLFKKNEANTADYEKEKTTIKSILTNKQYKDLMRFKDGKTMVVIKYLGTDVSVDQIIIFGYASDKGLALIRVIGDKMDIKKVGKLVMLARSGKIDTSKLKGLRDMF
ncbi:MAG: DUF4252 domain-containing protein [Flavobacteriaceae bacterium]|nr:DUF4252 domain-containing protein [Flavobacteriaceae bacterium]